MFEGNLGQSKAIRLVMRDYLKKLERKMDESEAAGAA